LAFLLGDRIWIITQQIHLHHDFPFKFANLPASPKTKPQKGKGKKLVGSVISSSIKYRGKLVGNRIQKIQVLGGYKTLFFLPHVLTIPKWIKLKFKF
jgi:hypothetical protein